MKFSRRKWLRTTAGLLVPAGFPAIVRAQFTDLPFLSSPPAASGGGGGHWTLLQFKKNDSAGATITPPLATTAGSTIIVSINQQVSSGAALSVADNASGGSNTYVKAGANFRAALVGAGAIDMWYAIGSHGGATLITVTPNAGTVEGLAVWEVSGLNASAPFDTSAAVTNSSSLSTQSGGTVTTSAAGDFIAAALTPGGAISAEHPGDGFTLDGIQTNSSEGDSHLTSNSAAAGNYTPQWDMSSAGTAAAVTAAFKL